jgi:general secretion pathway protein D
VVSPSRQKPPEIGGDAKLELDFALDTTLYDLIQFFADVKRKNFILADVKELQGKKVSIISHHKVTSDEAYEAFLSALQVSGYTVTESAGTSKIVKSSDASKTPIEVKTGDGLARASDAFVTQLIQLKNVSVTEVSKVIGSLVPGDAEVTAYAPTNTLIITDTAHNLRKVYKILRELDVAAPQSSLKIVALSFADAQEIKEIIEQLYGTEEAGESNSRGSRSSRTSSRRPTTSSRTSRTASKTTEPSAVGEASKYISKVLADERTNSLIVFANEEGQKTVADLVAKLDVDVDPHNKDKIHVRYLEHAKAEEVAQVLQELSQDSRSGQTRRGASKTASASGGTAAARSAAASRAFGRDGASDKDSGGSAVAAFDSGMRIAADETTNSLVIIASLEDYKVVDSVIKQLDIVRKQVYVDAVILELTSDDELSLGLASHIPMQPSNEASGFVGGQFNASSLGLSQDLLSGLAVGVFGESIEVPMADGTSLPIPAFGIVLNAIKSNSSTNIISNPNLLTLDNQEARIVVGRKIPFPTTAGLNNLGQPVVSFQREDVAITLEVTPRVNSSNFVTLEVKLEVAEIEEDSAGLDVAQAGFITSKREIETVALVQDNQTVVLGGLVGSTDNEVETKVPVLGDIPLLGALFRGSRSTTRKTNMMVFLTPHIVDDEDDMWEIQRIKEAQRQEFVRRFYGRSRDKYMEEIQSLLRYSMNYVDQPSMFRGPTELAADLELHGQPISDAARAEIEDALEESRGDAPGEGAGEIPEVDFELDDGTGEVEGVDPVPAPADDEVPAETPDEVP